jgi:hypothetical protein
MFSKYADFSYLGSSYLALHRTRSSQRSTDAEYDQESLRYSPWWTPARRRSEDAFRHPRHAQPQTDMIFDDMT